MAEKWLYLPIEVINRELDAKLLLTYYAVQKNYQVILGKQHKLYAMLNSLPKGILLSKGYPKNRKAPLFDAKNLGHAVVELDEEGLIINKHVYPLKRVQAEYFHMLDHIYCWGNKTREVLVNSFGQSEKVHLTGHPRFDLVKKKYRSIYHDEVEEIKQRYGSFILVNTRFGRYNHRKGFRQKEKHRLIWELYDSFIAMIKELSKKYPTKNIIIRPHPRENHNSYHEEFKQYDNVLVVHEGNIVKWNLAADVVIHNGCTTGIEAYLLDRPVISYLPVTTENETGEYLADAVSYHAFNLKELISLIDFLSDGTKTSGRGKKVLQRRKKLLASYYAAMDENYAVEKIIDLLGTLPIKSEQPFHISNLHIAPGSIEHEIELEDNGSLITKEKVISFLNKIKEIENTERAIDVLEVGRNLFVIK